MGSSWLWDSATVPEIQRNLGDAKKNGRVFWHHNWSQTRPNCCGDAPTCRAGRHRGRVYVSCRMKNPLGCRNLFWSCTSPWRPGTKGGPSRGRPGSIYRSISSQAIAQDMTTGISELMSAETRATHIVAEARNARGERLKVAKQDAQTVINMVRTEKEAAFLSRSNQATARAYLFIFITKDVAIG
mmetsp:Transcript_28386/g.87825  ORF Transcript_28386/g.87825 Transcript_28386/m.87825 type:complete len:185 (+) Transcript_28386:1093-1647(+)